MKGVLKRLADNSDSNSLAVRMRRARFAFFRDLLARVERPLRILDVGGTREFWDLMGVRDLGDVRITLFNMDPGAGESIAPYSFETGDARDLSRYDNASFDVVFSNSVIEHLGPRFSDQERMAKEIRRVGKRYFVQTPNRYFPLEPHFLTPGFQFFPLALRTWMVQHFSVGWYERIPDKARARREVESVVLLSRSQLRALFPEAQIRTERLLGVPKSYIAYHGW